MSRLKIFSAALVAGALGWAHATFASPITYDNYTVLNNQTVHIVDSALSVNETGGAGQITLLGGNIPGGSIATWCIDIAHFLLNPGSFASIGTLTGDFASKLNALISNGTPLLAGNTDASAALQIAIWEVEYGAAVTITTPNSSTLMNLANTYVANVSGANPTWKADPTMQVSYYSANGSNQDQAFLTKITAVPEPASIALLCGALTSIGFARRRRQAA